MHACLVNHKKPPEWDRFVYNIMYPLVFVPPSEPPLFVPNTKHRDGLDFGLFDLTKDRQIAGQFGGLFTGVALLRFSTTIVSMYERSLIVLIDIKWGSIETELILSGGTCF